jgi:hypothetical protein
MIHSAMSVVSSYRVRWLVVGCVLIVLSGAIGVFSVGAVSKSGDETVDDVVRALQNGDLKQGMKVPLRPKPWVEDAWFENRGPNWAVTVLRDETHVVLLYSHDNGTLFAACTIESRPTWSETWHFCDMDLMRQHVERDLDDK